MSTKRPSFATPKEEKPNKSLAWRLSLSQGWQHVWSFIKIDLLICLLFFICLIVWSETKASNVYYDFLTVPNPTINSNIMRNNGVQILPSNTAEGARFSVFKTDDRQKETPVSFRQIGMTDAFSSFAKDIHENARFPFYQVFFESPHTPDKYWEVRIHWELPCLFFGVALLLLLIYQLLSLPLSIIKSRNRIRKALQPIYELTTTAQNISSGAVDLSVPLSGTIDALKTITGSHFDRRIPVSHEREELKGLAQAINDMLDRLDASYQAQLRFVSDASHELRTPISIIQGYARLLSRWGKDDPKTLQESIDAIQSEAEGMQVLVEQLLFLARSDNQSLQIRKEQVDLSDLLTEVIRETEMICQKHTMVESIQPNISIVADSQLLKQATRILVDNSIKYTPENGRITIGLEEDENDVKIFVSDNGIGIAPDVLEHLFDRFWRADESRDRKTGGTGLGLSIARLIAESHSGYISVISRKDVGSKFSLCIPKALNSSTNSAPTQSNDKQENDEIIFQQEIS